VLMSRMGVPVTKQGRPEASPRPRLKQVFAKDTARTFARRAVARTLRPGTTFPSHITTGTRCDAAAISTGMAT